MLYSTLDFGIILAKGLIPAIQTVFLMSHGKEGGSRSTALVFLFEENFREAEAAAGKLAGIVVADERDTFLADFGEKNFPGILGDLAGVGLAAGLVRLRAGFLRFVARIGLFLFCGTWLRRIRHEGDGFLHDGRFRRHGDFGFLLAGLALPTAAAAAFLIRFGSGIRFGSSCGGRVFHGRLRTRNFERGFVGNPANLGLTGRSFGGGVCFRGHEDDGKAELLVVVDIVGG